MRGGVERRSGLGLGESLADGDRVGLRHGLPAAMHGRLEAVDRVGADNGDIGSEPKCCAGIEQITEGEDPVEAVRELAGEDFDVTQQMARLNAAYDAKLGESRHIGLVDEFGVLDAMRNARGTAFDRVQNHSHRRVADRVGSEVETQRFGEGQAVVKVGGCEHGAAAGCVGERVAVGVKHQCGAAVERAIGKEFAAGEASDR